MLTYEDARRLHEEHPDLSVLVAGRECSFEDVPAALVGACLWVVVPPALVAAAAG